MEESSRRPLKVRETKLAINISKKLSEKSITPNQISIMSILFSLLGAICLIILPYINNPILVYILLILIPLFIQMRLLCNLFDGMVAVEGNKFTKSGELYNDIPDRISDALLLIGLGYTLKDIPFAIELGYITAIFAILTAYIRTLAVSMKSLVDFSGPMAKQHRMATLTGVSLLSLVEYTITGEIYILFLIGLILICLGSILTIWNRIKNCFNYLEER